MILTCCLLLCGCGQQVSSPQETTQPQETVPQMSGTLPTEKVYKQREGIETILIMGLDKFESHTEEQTGYLNDQQADFLMLFILDQEAQKIDVLHLNRDTMTEIRRLGIGGGAAGKFTGQLCLSHTFGSGGSDSCLNTVKAVSTFLKGVKIDHYLAMTMDAVEILNDLVGGVTVTIPLDMTVEDPAFVEGAEVTMNGEQALKYVRARMSVGDGTNLSRMERQRQYLTALFQKVLQKMDEDDHFLNQSLLKLSSYFQSDYSVNQLDQLGDRIKTCEISPFVSIEGTQVVGEEFMEFYADEDSLNQVLIDLFCEP